MRSRIASGPQDPAGYGWTSVGFSRAVGNAVAPGRRYRELADAGVQTAIVALPDVVTPGALETFAEVIAAFRPGGAHRGGGQW